MCYCWIFFWSLHGHVLLHFICQILVLFGHLQVDVVNKHESNEASNDLTTPQTYDTPGTTPTREFHLP